MGNFLVTAAFLKTSSLRTSTNFYIVNMTTSDLVCWCFNWPLYATEGMLTRKQFIAGPSAVVACKLGMYFRGVSQVVSVLSLVLIAVDRYFAIVFPLKATLFNGKRARITLLLLTWIIPLLTGIPYFIYTGIVEVDGYNFCRTLWNRLFNTIFNLAGFVVFYCTPLISMIILYSRIVKTFRKGRAILDLMKEKRERQRQKNHEDRSSHGDRLLRMLDSTLRLFVFKTLQTTFISSRPLSDNGSFVFLRFSIPKHGH